MNRLFPSPGSLAFRHAVAALLCLPDGRYVMQRRDDRPGIFFPGFWGCFGGAIDDGETIDDALRRELVEEIGLDLRTASYFTALEFDLGFMNQGRIIRYYHEIGMSESDFASIALGEGSAFAAFTADELIRHGPTVPYDAYAIWLHAARPTLQDRSSSV